MESTPQKPALVAAETTPKAVAKRRVMKAASKRAKKAARKAAKKPARKKAATPRYASVFVYYAQLPPAQSAIAQKLDDSVAKNVPAVKRAMKWNVPFYGLEGRGWFCAFAAFRNHCSVNFFRGVKLKPEPPVVGVKENRRVVYRSPDEVDEAQLVSWVKQAAALQGWLA